MASVMQLDVLSPDAYVFQADDISYIEVQTTSGSLGILPHHATMVAALAQAPLKYRDAEGKAHYLCVDGGFLEVKENKVTILSVSAETPEIIDVAKAQASLDRAQAKIDNPPEDVDMSVVIKDLKKAQAQLKTVQLSGAK